MCRLTEECLFRYFLQTLERVISIKSVSCCNSFYFSFRHVASFLSMFKLLVIGVIIIGKDPFALFGMQPPGFWEWGQGNKVRFSVSLDLFKK